MGRITDDIIRKSELINLVTARDVVEHFGDIEILDEICVDDIIKYLKNKGCLKDVLSEIDDEDIIEYVNENELI